MSGECKWGENHASRKQPGKGVAGVHESGVGFGPKRDLLIFQKFF
jgi:hypothetical protein